MPKKPVKKPAAKKPAPKAKPAAKKPAPKPVAKKAAPAPKAAAKVISVKRAPRKLGKVVLPPNYKPSAKEEYMCNEQLEYFRQKLVSWKAELSTELKNTLDNLKEENWQESDITDRATVETDASLELRTRDRYRKLINKINDALIRIEKGDYGYCEETGEEIGLKRLEARPIATLSIEAQERHERDERTHYDEDMEERLA
jgi:DnaK suppressor protein